MISLRQSMLDQERMEHMLRAARECYRDAVELSRQHVVETDEATTRAFREELGGLGRLVRDASTPEELSDTRTALEVDLKDYAAQGNRYLRVLRQRLGDTSRALSDVMASLSQGNGADEERLWTGLTKLEEIAQQPELRRVCPEMAVVVANLEGSFDRLRQQNRLVVAQLRNELHALRDTLDHGRSGTAPVSLPGVLSRADIRLKIRTGLDNRMNFCLVALRIGNGPHLRGKLGDRYGRFVLPEFCERFVAVLEPGTLVGRWADDQFLVHMVRPKPEAMWLADHLANQLSGPYVLPGDEDARDISLVLRTGVLEAGPGSAEAKLLATIDKVMAALD